MKQIFRTETQNKLRSASAPKITPERLVALVFSAWISTAQICLLALIATRSSPMQTLVLYPRDLGLQALLFVPALLAFLLLEFRMDKAHLAVVQSLNFLFFISTVSLLNRPFSVRIACLLLFLPALSVSYTAIQTLRKQQGKYYPYIFSLYFFVAVFLMCLTIYSFVIQKLWQGAANYVLPIASLTLLFAVALSVAREFHRNPLRRDFKRLFFGVLILSVSAFHWLWLGAIMTARTQGLLAPAFDFGIFVQNFESVRRNGQFLSTIERDHLMSHFEVHLSPIYYLLAPIYALIPHPLTLQWAQILMVMSGVIPFILCMKALKLDSKYTLLLILLYFAHPALLGSSLYDFHENAFLTPLLFWLFWAMLKRKRVWIAVFGTLILFVKEDAFLYLAAALIFYFFDRPRTVQENTLKRRLDALLFFAFALAYFILALSYLNRYGQGAMTDRFSNLMLKPELGLFGALLNILQNPGHILAILTKTVKQRYFLSVLGALAFLPLIQRKGTQYFLLLPLVIINLISDYSYQYDLGFQYGYGSASFLLLATALFFADWKPLERIKNKALQNFFVAAVLAPSLLISGKLLFSHNYAVHYVLEAKTEISLIKKSLDSLVSRDQKILTATFLAPYLADAPELYQTTYHHEQRFDPEIAYLIFDARMPEESDEALRKQYQSHGYRLLQSPSHIVQIWVRPDLWPEP